MATHIPFAIDLIDDRLLYSGPNSLDCLEEIVRPAQFVNIVAVMYNGRMMELPPL